MYFNDLMANELFEIKNGYPTSLGYKEVDWDEAKTGDENTTLATFGVNTCVGVTLYDPNIQKGVLAHITCDFDMPISLLPENLVDSLVERLYGEDKDDYSTLQATIVGNGGFLDRSNDVKTIEDSLKSLNIPIIGKDVGGNYARNILFNCSTGKVEVYR